MTDILEDAISSHGFKNQSISMFTEIQFPSNYYRRFVTDGKMK